MVTQQIFGDTAYQLVSLYISLFVYIKRAAMRILLVWPTMMQVFKVFSFENRQCNYESCWCESILYMFWNQIHVIMLKNLETNQIANQYC